MRDILAEKVLVKVMGWTQETIAKKRPVIEALALKYDEYQQFSPGRRFIESFALWLEQFSEQERLIAYEFIIKKLIFISSAEMTHFITISYPDIIRPLLFDRTAQEINCETFRIIHLFKSKEFKLLRRQSLFLGLSDGSHTDIFRRINSEISNEQIWQTYDISSEKAKDLERKLKEDLTEILGETPIAERCKFKQIFLLDDFSGSGISYIRWNPESNKFEGKLVKVLNKFLKSKEFDFLISLDKIMFCLVLYTATAEALEYIENNLRLWQKENNIDFPIKVKTVQKIEGVWGLNKQRETAFLSIAEKYFDPNIVDEHYKKGKHELPWMGFNEAGLPLVLYHNTPNNSIPLIWAEEDGEIKGLFTRIKRHRGEL